METQENHLSNCCDNLVTETGFCTQCWEACDTYELELKLADFPVAMEDFI
jgi:hypothetical protein